MEVSLTTSNAFGKEMNKGTIELSSPKTLLSHYINYRDLLLNLGNMVKSSDIG